MKPLTKIFVAGWISHAAWNSLMQDYFGKERYLKLADTAWVPATTTVPLAIIMLWLAWVWCKGAKKEIAETTFEVVK